MYSYKYYFEACNYLKSCGFKPNNILDIGANLCQTADISRSVWPNSNILLFDGNKNCEQLYQQKKYNYQIKLLGSYNGEVTFYKTRKNDTCSGNSIYKENSNYYNKENLIEEVLPIYKLDDCVKEKYDFIKIDTQGSELDIIKGGVKTIYDSKVLIVEVSLINFNEGGCKKADVVDFILSLNFDFITKIEIIWDNNEQIIGESLLFIKP